jgi:hypothetical protein
MAVAQPPQSLLTFQRSEKTGFRLAYSPRRALAGMTASARNPAHGVIPVKGLVENPSRWHLE